MTNLLPPPRMEKVAMGMTSEGFLACYKQGHRGRQRKGKEGQIRIGFGVSCQAVHGNIN